MSSVNQWRDTDSVITWLESMKNKNKCIFMQYDIEEVYPSISEDLLKKSISYATTVVDISSNKEETIKHSRKFLLFNNSDMLIKKTATRILMLLSVALTTQKFGSWLVLLYFIYIKYQISKKS